MSAFVYGNVFKKTFEVFSITWNSKKLPNNIPKGSPDRFWYGALYCLKMSHNLASHLNRYSGNKWKEFKKLYLKKKKSLIEKLKLYKPSQKRNFKTMCYDR